MKQSGSLTIFLLFFVVLYKVTGFNILECLKVSLANNEKGMSIPFDNAARWGMRSTINVLGYFASLGLALSALFIYSVYKFKEHQVGIKVFLLAVVGALFFASVSGLFHGETERVWLFFTPGLALIAGAIYDTKTREYLEEGFPLAISWTLIFALLYEVLFRHYV